MEEFKLSGSTGLMQGMWLVQATFIFSFLHSMISQAAIFAEQMQVGKDEFVFFLVSELKSAAFSRVEGIDHQTTDKPKVILGGHQWKYSDWKADRQMIESQSLISQLIDIRHSSNWSYWLYLSFVLITSLECKLFIFQCVLVCVFKRNSYCARCWHHHNKMFDFEVFLSSLFLLHSHIIRKHNSGRGVEALEGGGC